jgi:RNA polymerase sigma-70 factor
LPVPPPLCEIFLESAPAGTAVPGDRSDLERLLDQAFETARAPWPDLSLTAVQFIRHVAEHLPLNSHGQPVELVLKSLHLSDLYLACTCALGVPRAADILERDYLAKVPGILRRHRHSPEMIDDVCQKLREKLVLHAHVATYTGEGKLWSWVEVIAKRMANQEARPTASESSGLSKLIAGFASTGDLEKDVLKKNLMAEFQSALSAAGSTLSDEQRALLKLHYRNGLSEAKLAMLFKTSQPTISRRLKSAREAIFNETKHRLRERLGLAEKDFDSFLADVQSQWLDLSLSQLFGGSEGSAPPLA